MKKYIVRLTAEDELEEAFNEYYDMGYEVISILKINDISSYVRVVYRLRDIHISELDS